EVGGERVEGHRSVDIALVAVGPPDDALVRDLLDDLRLPGAVRPEDLRLPGETLVALLLDVLDLLHEGREVLEAGPLVVDDVDRRPDVDRLDHVGDLLLVALGPPSGLAGEPFTDLGDALRQRADALDHLARAAQRPATRAGPAGHGLLDPLCRLAAP